MKIILPGGTGQLGRLLARDFHAAGHQVVVFTRHPRPAPWRVLPWDATTLGAWAQEIDGADVVINLTGRSVNCRYTPERRREIIESRTHSTRVVGEAILRAARPPRTWLQMSSATIYSHRFDAPNDETTGQITGSVPERPWGFSVGVVQAWERALFAFETPATRQVALRSSIVMSAQRGGIFEVFVGLVRRGLGGTIADGRQMVSWIHEADFLRVIHWLIEHEDLSGVVNITSPHAVPNAEFMRDLRRACGMPFGLPSSRWMLEIGTRLLRTEPELVLKSRWSYPRRLLESGFAFEWTRWEEAAVELYDRWREARREGVEVVAPAAHGSAVAR
jgi:uncharacterized protein (TIGR01777 family)